MVAVRLLAAAAALGLLIAGAVEKAPQVQQVAVVVQIWKMKNVDQLLRDLHASPEFVAPAVLPVPKGMTWHPLQLADRHALSPG